MSDINPKLAAALKEAKTHEMDFALVAIAMADGTLLVAKANIPARQIEKARAELGGGKIFPGRCKSEDGKPIFDFVEEPSASIANQLRRIISRDGGLTLAVEARTTACKATSRGPC